MPTERDFLIQILLKQLTVYTCSIQQVSQLFILIITLRWPEIDSEGGAMPLNIAIKPQKFSNSNCKKLKLMEMERAGSA